MTFKQILQSRAKKTVETKALKKFSPYDIIVAPLMTEKSHKAQADDNKYSFKVHTDANKNDVKQAIEFLYKVTPKNINIVSVVFKGRSSKKLVRKAYKKAIVTIGKKEKLEV